VPNLISKKHTNSAATGKIISDTDAFLNHNGWVYIRHLWQKLLYLALFRCFCLIPRTVVICFNTSWLCLFHFIYALHVGFTDIIVSKFPSIIFFSWIFATFIYNFIFFVLSYPLFVMCSSLSFLWVTSAVYCLEIRSKIFTEERNGRSMLLVPLL
jgi:hypothetical protein